MIFFLFDVKSRNESILEGVNLENKLLNILLI